MKKTIGTARYNLDGRTYPVIAKTGTEFLLAGLGWVHAFSVTLLTIN